MADDKFEKDFSEVSQEDLSEADSVTGKKKRKRTVIGTDQLAELEKVFSKEPWPSRDRKIELASQIGASKKFVSVWFQNKRAKLRKENLKDEIFPSSVSISTASNKPLKIPIARNPKMLAKPNHAFCKPILAIDNAGPLSLASKSREKCSTIKIKLPSQSPKESACITTVVKPVAVRTRMSSFEGLSSYPPASSTLNANGAVSTSSALIADCNKVEGQYGSAVDNVQPPMGQPSIYQASNPYDSSSWHPHCYRPSFVPTLFHSIINMMAMGEGGIVNTHHPEFDSAVSSYLYGIKLADVRLVYNKEVGFDFETLL